MTIEENFKKSFGMEFKDIEEQLRQYVQKFSFLMEKRTLTREYALDRDVRVDKMTDGESQTVLADLLINLGRFEDAEKRLQKAAAGQEIPASAKAALGWVSFLNKRPEMAETRLQEATRVDPGNYRGNLYLARALASKGRQEDALAAYKKAAESGEATAQLYAEIADLYVDMQRDGEAIEAFKKALNLEADNARYFRSVTYAYLRRGEWKFASMSAMTYLRDEGWRDDSSPYMVLAGLFGYLHTNSEPDVKRVLTQALERLDKANWPYPVFEYLNGARDSASLIEAAGTDNDKLTEAHAYIGINLAIQDKKDEAATHLSWVVENGNKRFVEYPWAASELKRIVEPEGPSVAK
jgi:tetratricopeptide (TPR) repeat protein